MCPLTPFNSFIFFNSHYFLYFCTQILRTKQNNSIMRVIIQSDYQKLSQWAADHVIERINKFNPTPDHKFVLGPSWPVTSSTTLTVRRRTSTS